MNAGRFNHGLECPVGEEWPKHMAQAKAAMEDVAELKGTMLNILTYVEHLEKLDKLEVIASAITSMEDKLLNAATGRDQIPTNVVTNMLNTVDKSRASIVRIFSAIVAGLIFVIVFLLTGTHYGFLPPLHG